MGKSPAEKSPRGRRAKSERLLARLGILRCGTCGGRLVVGSATRRSTFYRCTPTSDCPRRVTISADIAEAPSPRRCKSSCEVSKDAPRPTTASRRERELERCEHDLDAAVTRVHRPRRCHLSPRAAARAPRRPRPARERLDELGAAAPPTIRSPPRTGTCSPSRRRALIRAVVDSHGRSRPRRRPHHRYAAPLATSPRRRQGSSEHLPAPEHSGCSASLPGCHRALHATPLPLRTSPSRDRAHRGSGCHRLGTRLFTSAPHAFLDDQRGLFAN